MPEMTSTRRIWIAALLVVALAGAAFFAWRTIYPRESTDDAQVTGHVYPVPARVPGTVDKVLVNDNQVVKAGDVLVEIDSRDNQMAVDRAAAELAAADAALRAARASVPITTASATNQASAAQATAGAAEAAARAGDREVESARAKLSSARAHAAESAAAKQRTAKDLERLASLIAKDEVSRRDYDAAVAAAAAASAAADAADAGIAEAQANLNAAEARRQQMGSTVTQTQAQARAAGTAPQQIALIEARARAAEAEVARASAALDQAKLNLERTIVRAPQAGIVSRKSVEPGQMVQAGQNLLALIALEDVWITANFKETQLKSIRAGESVKVSVDALGRSFAGHVDSIAAATGATFSLLPPENATGNFVKVVQRVPVKITLDAAQAEHLLRPGMSVVATVYTR
jgi:membrane fusion protein (multidrug efflux system)